MQIGVKRKHSPEMTCLPPLHPKCYSGVSLRGGIASLPRRTPLFSKVDVERAREHLRQRLIDIAEDDDL